MDLVPNLFCTRYIFATNFLIFLRIFRRTEVTLQSIFHRGEWQGHQENSFLQHTKTLPWKHSGHTVPARAFLFGYELSQWRSIAWGTGSPKDKTQPWKAPDLQVSPAEPPATSVGARARPSVSPTPPEPAQPGLATPEGAGEQLRHETCCS